MSHPAEAAIQPTVTGATLLYEQPLNERMRTFLRLEFLYKQILYHSEHTSAWSSRSAVESMLDIVAILSRGDVRGDVLKELERQKSLFDRLQRTQDVDEDRLNRVLRNLEKVRADLNAVGPQYLQPLRDSEFLNAIRHRSGIPGGTCAFDLPDYTHWLRQSFERRSGDLQGWLRPLHSLCDGVSELLWLVRNSRQPVVNIATNGVYQHSLSRDSSPVLVRLALATGENLYPEVSGGHHRFTVRFMRWSDTSSRPLQAERDVEFQLTIC